jgi:ribosome-binding protein aMBF1 (putative translation factor)
MTGPANTQDFNNISKKKKQFKKEKQKLIKKEMEHRHQIEYMRESAKCNLINALADSIRSATYSSNLQQEDMLRILQEKEKLIIQIKQLVYDIE